MKIIYTFGGAGSGKFENCIKDMLKRQDEGRKSILIIPEQFTMQAEKRIMETSENKVLFNIQVLNFKRLAYRIFSELGMIEEKPLEDIGKIMVIRKILINLAKKETLKYFSESAYNNLGLIEKIANILEEFFEFDVSPKSLEQAILAKDISKNENLILKLSDLREIYISYKEFLQSEYITNEEVLDILYKKIDKSGIINEEIEIFIYGFESFNNQEFNILYKLFEKCSKVHIYLTLNTKQTYFENLKPFDYYYDIKNTVNKINNNILQKLNVQIEDVVFLENDKRHMHNEELAFLQNNFFAYPYDIFGEMPQNISITQARNKYIEMNITTQNIISLVKNEGFRFSDITIILGDVDYENALKIAFNKYNIPYFLDDKKNISNHSLVGLIVSALDIILYNYKYESIFRYLKTGYLDALNIYNITKEDINLIENYILKYGIKGEKWKKEFTYGFYEKSQFKKEEINQIRENILKSLSKLDLKKTKKYTALQICTSILDFLVDIKIEDTMNFIINRDKDLLSQNVIKNAGSLDENIQVFNAVSSIFQKIVDILGNEKLNLDEFCKILKIAFEKETISIIPPKQDQILIGNFDRTKITENKVLFAVGMNEGYVPSYNEESPFISDVEKIALMQKGIELRKSTTTTIATDMLKIYSLILKPKDRLFLSYATSDLTGGTKKPSSIIEKVKDIFPKINEKKVENLEFDVDNIPDMIFEEIFENIAILENIDEDEKLQNITKWFLNNEKYAEKLEHIQKGIYNLENEENDFIDKHYLQKLYEGEEVFSSVSKLEEFNRCPFSYFLKYNLKLRERDLYILDYLKLGNLYHSILEQFSREVFKEGYNIPETSESVVQKLVNKAFQKEMENEQMQSLLNTSAKYNYYFNRIKKITTMSAIAIIKQLQNGEFIPKQFEFDFDDISYSSNAFNSIKIPLNTNYDMILKGKIDRIDKMSVADKDYIKIIDYKSSDKKLNIDDVYYGLQLQLLMYLNAFIKIEKSISEKEVLPAGAFYFQVQEAILKEEKNIEDIEKEFDIKGLVLNERAVLKGLDKEFKESGRKSIKGVSSSEVLNMDKFQKLLDISYLKSKEIGEKMTKGNIKLEPYRYDKSTGCDYCNFKDICKIDMVNIKNKYKFLKKMEKEETWNKIDKFLADENKI